MFAPPRPLEIPSGQKWGAGLTESLHLPPSLCVGLRFSPEQFAELCVANPEAVLELAADGSLILMTPTGSETGGRNGSLLVELGLSLRASGLPLKLFDSSSGFRLPDNSVLSPDASLVALDRWQALSEAERRGFAPLCPDLVIELASPSDEGPRGLTALRQKWPPTSATAPASAGCCFQRSGRWRSGNRWSIHRPSPGGWKRPPTSMQLPTSPAWWWN